MAERSIPSGMGKKARVDRQTLPAVQLDAGAGQKLEAVRHHGFSRSVGISGMKCAVPGPRGPSHSLEPPSSPAAMHFSGDASDTRPLQPIPQLSDEHNEMSSTASSTINLAISTDGRMASGKTRGKDPGVTQGLEQVRWVTPGHPATNTGGETNDLRRRVAEASAETMKISPPFRTSPKQNVGDAVCENANGFCSISGNGQGYVQLPLEALGIAPGNSVLISQDIKLWGVRSDLGNSAGLHLAKGALRVGAGEELTRGLFEIHGQVVRRIPPRPVSPLPAWTVRDSRDAPALSLIGANDQSMTLTQLTSNCATTTGVSQQGTNQWVPCVYTQPETKELYTAAQTVGNAKAYIKYPTKASVTPSSMDG